MKILVVDDDKAVLGTFEMLLRHHGHNVDCCDNAQDAIPMVENGQYDFVLVDYRMPDNTGAWMMKNTNLPPKTKALLVTGLADKEVINQMFDLGVSGYLIKPVDEEELLRHLSYHSDSQQPTQACCS